MRASPPIYEGTNGIQAIDLVTRKLPLADGAVVRGYIAELRAIADRRARENRRTSAAWATRLDAALDDLRGRDGRIFSPPCSAGRTAEALAGATPYLRLFGLAAGGAYLAQGARSRRSARRRRNRRAASPRARFFAEQLAAGDRGACERRSSRAPRLVLGADAADAVGGMTA